MPVNRFLARGHAGGVTIHLTAIFLSIADGFVPERVIRQGPFDRERAFVVVCNNQIEGFQRLSAGHREILLLTEYYYNTTFVPGHPFR